MNQVLNSMATMSMNELLVLKFEVDLLIDRKQKEQHITVIQDENLYTAKELG